MMDQPLNVASHHPPTSDLGRNPCLTSGASKVQSLSLSLLPSPSLSPTLPFSLSLPLPLSPSPSLSLPLPLPLSAERAEMAASTSFPYIFCLYEKNQAMIWLSYPPF